MSHHPLLHPLAAPALLARVACVLACLAATPALSAPIRIPERSPDDPVELLRRGLPLERNPGAPPAGARLAPLPERPASVIGFGRFTIRQVNVSALGNDVVGDAANEPSLAVDPNDHDRMVIGWRQFSSVNSNFRQAGFGYSADGGVSWTMGVIEPGVFRSDPVLGIDGTGDFIYNSLTVNSAITAQIFRSADGGATWGPSVFAYGGDKQWMVIDRGLEDFYQAWSIAANSYAPNTFARSIDDGASFLTPTSIPNAPIWGTLDVAPDHSLYVVGWETQADTLTGNLLVAHSTDASSPDPGHVPVFATTVADIGGIVSTGPPNPDGLLGQAWIAVDRSSTVRSGWIYVLSSVQTPTDPLDVNFIRSADGGATWSAPVRVNDDPGHQAYQWFGTMSVSPSGRIDAVWNDTRGSADSTVSALYYSYSTDGGATWSANEQVTPTWNCTLGYPNQSKIGDYYDMVSDDTGADVAFAATFNGSEDVYYVRIPNTAAPVGVPAPIAVRVRLLPNVPNPFAATTALRFDAPSQGARVRLEIFDIAGQRVATLLDGRRSGANQSVRWDGRGADGRPVGPGVYLCRLSSGGVTETRRVLRLR